MNNLAANPTNSLIYGHILRLRLILAFVFITTCFVTSLHVSANSAEFTQSYDTLGAIAPGAVVSLVDGKDKTVETAKSTSPNKVIGIYVDKNSSLAETSTDTKTGSVATYGQAQALVTDIYGYIKSGDLLVLSPIDGVAARTVKNGYVVGVAQADFDAQSQPAAVQEVSKSDGTKINVKVGSIPILVNPQGVVDQKKPAGVRGFFESVAGRNLSDVRIALTVFIGILLVVILGALVAGSIRSGITSVGRNPLAHVAIFESMMQVMAMVLLISILGVTVMYAILRL